MKTIVMLALVAALAFGAGFLLTVGEGDKASGPPVALAKAANDCAREVEAQPGKNRADALIECYRRLGAPLKECKKLQLGPPVVARHVYVTFDEGRPPCFFHG